LTPGDRDVHQRIGLLVESLKDDPVRANELFRYAWTMICVQRGLLRVIREIGTRDGVQLVLEEVSTGNRRVVSRPPGLEPELEPLAIRALARIMDVRPVARSA
jgi:hypothetical protein